MKTYFQKQIISRNTFHVQLMYAGLSVAYQNTILNWSGWNPMKHSCTVIFHFCLDKIKISCLYNRFVNFWFISNSLTWSSAMPTSILVPGEDLSFVLAWGLQIQDDRKLKLTTKTKTLKHLKIILLLFYGYKGFLIDMIRVFQIVQIYENMDLGTNFQNSDDSLGKLTLNKHIIVHGKTTGFLNQTWRSVVSIKKRPSCIWSFVNSKTKKEILFWKITVSKIIFIV